MRNYLTMRLDQAEARIRELGGRAAKDGRLASILNAMRDELTALPEPPKGIVNAPLACGHTTQIKRAYLDLLVPRTRLHCHECGTAQELTTL